MKTYSRKRNDMYKNTRTEISASNRTSNTHFPFPVVVNFENNDVVEAEVVGESGLRAGKIKIMIWNAGGLTNKFDRLMKTMKKERIHFAVVVETWWRVEGSIPKPCLLNAICPSEDLLKLSGMNGISLIVNPEFATLPWMSSLVLLAKDTMFGCYLSFSVAGLQFAAIYRAPSLALTMDELLDKVFEVSRLDLNSPIFILGDFNARLLDWEDIQDNDDGKALSAWMENKGFLRISSGNEATFDNGRGTSIVDHVFSNVFEAHVRNFGKPMSLVDHSALVLETEVYKSRAPKEDRTYTRILTEKLHDMDIRNDFMLRTEAQASQLAEAVELLSNNRNLETLDKVDQLFCNFFKSVGQSILGTKTAGKRAFAYKPLDSAKLRSLYFQQEFSPSRETEHDIVKELTRLRKIRFDEFTSELGKKPIRDVLKIVAQINSNRKLRQFALQDNPVALKEYSNHFKQMNTNTLPPAEFTEVQLNPDFATACSIADSIFTATELLNILHSVPWNKAAGASGVSYDLLKAASFGTLSHVASWFKICFEIGLVPSSWTRSLVVPVPKKGDLNMIKNYRPISLTECFRKLFEHCVNRHILKTFPQNHFSQGGFRSHHCVNDMVIGLHQVLSTRKNMHVAFLDIKAAYDSVDRCILWRRCKDRGFSDELIMILKRLFDHNSAQLVVGGKRSEPFRINDGVLQGSVLSPTLYAIFIDDLAKELNRQHSVTVGQCKLNATLYADDIAVFSQSKEGLQLLLAICSSHAKRNRYQFNVAKCAVIGDPLFNYQLDGQPVPHVQQFTYLGVETNRNGIMKEEFVNRRCKGAIEAGYKLISLGMNSGGFSLRNNVTLYKTFVRSKLEALCGILPPSRLLAKKLEAAQRTILARIFFCSPNSSGTILRSLTNCPTMAFRMKYLRSRYVRRVLNLPTTHILRRMQSCLKFYVDKLMKDTFTLKQLDPANKTKLIAEEMESVHLMTKEATGGFLDLVGSIGLPWFSDPRLLTKPLQKRLFQWILKKFPASAPPRCNACTHDRCTQSHLADCRNILAEFAPDVPARYRPEHLLSARTVDLPVIAHAVNNAICSCLPLFNVVM